SPTTTGVSSILSVTAGMVTALSISPLVKALIVDDNNITAKMLSKILTKEFGHLTSCTASGKEALNKLSLETFNIIFMNIDIPEISGIETTLAIHSTGSKVLEKNRQIPIIAYTTNPCEDRYFEVGMNGWVGKPASQSSIRQELERVMLLDKGLHAIIV
ncbi:6126_t:CDS:1, partial [Dentiscutata heterogama]